LCGFGWGPFEIAYQRPVDRAASCAGYFDTKVDAVLAWYAPRLSGFRKTHGYAAGRSQDTFYNADGTVIVSVTGEPGKEGENTNAYSVLYAKFQPGLSEKTIVEMNIQKVTCP
jgi:hypothetical protein